MSKGPNSKRLKNPSKIPIPPQPPSPPKTKTKTKTKTKPKHNIFAKWNFTEQEKEKLSGTWVKNMSNNNYTKKNPPAKWKFPKENRTTYWNKVSPTRLKDARDAYKTNKRSIRRVMNPIPPKLAEKAAEKLMKKRSRKPQSGNSRVTSLPYNMPISRHNPVKEWKPVPGEHLKAEIAALNKSRQYPKYTKPKPKKKTILP